MDRSGTSLTVFLRDRTGNVLPIAAVGLIVSAALVGGGIDMSRAYRVENRLQAACDSAVLAGRKSVSTNGFDQTAETQANNYFQTNFDESALEAHDTSFQATSPDNGATVEGAASATLDTAVMQLFGFNDFSLSVNCSASMGAGNSDVVMVLDTTGSMGWSLSGSYQSRIQALRTAMKNFYDTLSTATGGTNARIRYGFVPYSSSVNVGQLLYDLNPDYLRDSWPIQSRQALYADGSDTTYSASWYGSWGSWSYGSCPSAGDWSNTGDPSLSDGGSTYTQTQRRRVYDCSGSYYRRRWEYRDASGTTNTNGTGSFIGWRYTQVTYDVSAYKAGSSVTTYTGGNSSPQAVTSTWAGCIEERETVSEPSFSYSSVLGITPSGAFDLDIDSAPTSDATRWAPMWPQVAYNRSSSTNGWSVNSYCPHQAQLLAEMTEGEFDSYADSLNPEGNTYLDLGMIWGGRLSSPEGIFAANVNEAPANGGEVSRHLIFMTDGEMQPNNSIQTSYGIETLDRRVTDDGSSGHTSRHTSRFLAVCQAIKAKGIRIWVIAFTSGLSSDLQTCASTDSSFTANSADELNEAFQEIAKQVGELRLIQ